ncbi:carboxypeptidase regulatory-like domain-containing protein [Candidatus Woesearchaeota archaeon]|nr:carboxypeptidase regulatory-like domain-containing protein [Candidatus Woesearchaeota archaeon]
MTRLHKHLKKREVKLVKLRLLFIALLLAVLFSLQASAQGWYTSGPFDVGKRTCGDVGDPLCLAGEECYNFQCRPCSSSPGVCQTWSGGGGCGISNLADGSQPAGCTGSNFCNGGQCKTCATAGDGARCNPSGWGCSGGTCVNCQPAGNPCGGGGGCCGGTTCDATSNVCVSCDANDVQTQPTPGYGGGKCEASCGAASQCDEVSAGGFVLSGVCNSQCQYYDGDSSAASCNSAVGSGKWSVGGEVAGGACCGDDAGEAYRWRECSGGACLTDLNDNACCDLSSDCVYNDKCYYDVDVAITAETASIEIVCDNKQQTPCENDPKCAWNVALSSCHAKPLSRADIQTGGKYDSYTNVGGSSGLEVCDPGEWFGTSGSIEGYVRNVSTFDSQGPCPAEGCPVVGSLVRILGTAFTATTNGTGFYRIDNVPSTTYDIVAAKSDYDARTENSILVPDGGVATVNFVLVHSSGECKDDCIKVGTNVCESNCHGKGLCWFFSEETRQACDDTFGLTDLPGNRAVVCCEGAPYGKLKATVNVPASQVIKTEKPVVYAGVPVKLVTLVFIQDKK